MKTLKHISGQLLFWLAIINAEYLDANPGISQESLKILFIGSSYFNTNDLPAIFENLAVSADKEVFIGHHGRNGLYLDDHAASSTTEAIINERNWDVVVLQGVGTNTAYPDYFTDHPVYPALVTLKDKIKQNCNSTRMIYCLPWAFEDGMTWYQGWTDTYADMQIKIYNTVLQYSDSIGFEIAPVGWAWYTVLEEKGYPLHFLHLSDWNHPSVRGSYLMACAIYASIYKESAIDIPYTHGLPEEETDYYQTVASNTVLNSLELWNLVTTTGIDSDVIPGRYALSQNYPNPFNPVTTIDFSLPREDLVTLVVYNLGGQRIASLANRKYETGEYSIVFDATNLPSGIYMVKLKAGQYHQVRKMTVLK